MESLGTENGTWGAVAGDVRYWLDDRLQTVAGVVCASVNLALDVASGPDNTAVYVQVGSAWARP